MPKENGKGKAAILSNEEQDQIVKYSSKPYDLMFAIAGYTGARMGEVRTLRAENLFLGQSLILFTHTKTGTHREVDIHPELQVLIEAAELPTEGYLFPSPRTGGPVSRQSVDKELRAVCADLGFSGVGTHSFRRSLATNLNDQGLPLKTIASITGHESLNELSRYLEVTPLQRRAAIMAR
jgi:integrase/recombinase XerD